MTTLQMLHKDEQIRAALCDFIGFEDIVIPAIPTPQKRHRSRATFSSRVGKHIATTYKTKDQFKSEKIIRDYMIDQWQGFEPIRSPIKLSCCFYFPVPKSWSKKKTALALHKVSKPDLSNLIKQIEDCGNGILWADDALIVGYYDCYKLYTDYEPCTIIRIKF